MANADASRDADVDGAAVPTPRRGVVLDDEVAK
jgi:hypothetical protein